MHRSSVYACFFNRKVRPIEKTLREDHTAAVKKDVCSDDKIAKNKEMIYTCAMAICVSEEIEREQKEMRKHGTVQDSTIYQSSMG